MDNAASRLNPAFFYGLYMDPELLEAKGVTPRNPRKGVVRGYRLRIGNMATLLREDGAEAHGMLYDLTHAELHSLYRGAGLDAYVAEALLVDCDGEGPVAALCCNLLEPPAEAESNPDYLGKLELCMQRLDLPPPRS